MAKKSRFDEEGWDGYDWYEGQKKWPLTRVFGVLFLVISALVWGIILFRIFSAQDKGYENMILLNDRAAAIYPEEESEVVRIVPATEGQTDNAVLVQTPVYLEQVRNFQFTVRIRKKLFAPAAASSPGYTFLLRETGDEGTKTYQLAYYQTKTRFGYAFYRLAFEGVTFSEENEYVFLIYPYGEETGDALFRFTLYDETAYAHKTRPKDSVFVLLES